MSDLKKGITSGVLCYLCWGFFPIYWKFLSDIDHIEILSHRVIWSVLFYALIMLLVFKIKFQVLFQQSGRSWVMSLLAALLLAVNWGLYIYAVNHGHILEGSLAYFINPLLNVLVGVVFYKEKFPFSLKMAVGLAAVGVLWKVISASIFPWISLILATTFCAYGVVKKNLKVEPRVSSVMEGLTLLLPAIVFAVFARVEATVSFTSVQWSLLVFSGIVTGVPLLLFSIAAQKIPYSMMGVLQFIAPSLQFLVGYFIYKEAVTYSDWWTFSLIWAGAGFYLYQLARVGVVKLK
jgi:chloramphenicol-sensitive protein RarD